MTFKTDRLHSLFHSDLFLTGFVLIENKKTKDSVTLGEVSEWRMNFIAKVIPVKHKNFNSSEWLCGKQNTKHFAKKDTR